MGQSDRREHLINTAISLFCQYGYHATGIDKILSTAGVSKKTMYVHFRSKEELIYAALKKYDGIFRNNFMKEVEKTSSTPEERILGIFDVAGAWFNDNNFFGCMFINAVGEYSEQGSPIRDISKQFKQLMWDYIASLVQDAGIKDYKPVTDEICILIDGAIVTAQVSNKPEAALTAKKMAQKLLQHHMDKD